jgi:branched-chain amino acid transport system substrate-binding protein
MRQQEVNATFMAGDGITTDEFASIGGPAVVGTLMTFRPDPGNYPEAKVVIEKFRAKRFAPEAHTLYSYAAVQIIKQAAEAARSVDPKNVAEKMHSGMNFKTVIGDISFDEKGDITQLGYVMYVWSKGRDGKISYFEK